MYRYMGENNIKFLLIMLAVIGSFLCIPLHTSLAAVMPVYERLQPVTSNLNAPTAVALDSNERIYVAESINNKLLIYSQSGQYLDSLSGLKKPISAAVDGNGRIFIGNKTRGNVEVYDADLAFLFKLGTGDGEFAQPGAIAINSAGDIYVADSEEDVIKIYNPDGTFNFSFGSSGSGDGEFNFPTSIAINETAEEIIISDLQLIQDMYGGEIEGARIQVLDMNGVFKRSFGEYGVGEGLMAKPMGVTVDSEGRIYVTDSYQHIVHVFDSNGTFLGTVYNLDNPMRTPLSIAIGNSNRLFIASLNTGKVEVYGIDQYTQMEVSPLTLSYEGQEDGADPASQNVTITNNGTGTLTWTAEASDSWITLSGTSGLADPSDSSVLNVGADLNGLSVGTYTGSVSIRAGSGAMEVVDIELTVLPMPQLSVIPSALEFISQNGSVPSSQGLSIENTGEGTLNWSASSDRSWILIDKETGTAPDTIVVSIDVSSMGAGTYTGAITITGGGSAIIPVTLNIIEVVGTINVTTNLADAAFTINGSGSYSGSGMSWAVTDAPIGTYTIIFGAVEGYTTPSSQNQTLQTDGTINFSGDYEEIVEAQQAVNKNIIVGHGPGKRNNGLVKVMKSDGSETGVEFFAHKYTYGVNVAAGDINCDGVDEVITAPGPGPKNPAKIKIFDKNGNHLRNLIITAFKNYKYGANVASGDFNGDGYHEVVAGVGAVPGNPAYVKVFVYDTTKKKMINSGIKLLAYDRKYGVRVAAGDVDDDGIDEIITAPGPDEFSKGVLIKIWEVNTSSGIGQWSASLSYKYTVKSRHRYSVSITSGDINGDGYDEVIAGEGPYYNVPDKIKVFDRNGEIVSKFRAYIGRHYAANMASDDIDNDGVAEIIVGAGPHKRKKGIVKIYNANGVRQARFTAFNAMYGVNVAVGDLGWE